MLHFTCRCLCRFFAQQSLVIGEHFFSLLTLSLRLHINTTNTHEHYYNTLSDRGELRNWKEFHKSAFSKWNSCANAKEKQHRWTMMEICTLHFSHLARVDTVTLTVIIISLVYLSILPKVYLKGKKSKSTANTYQIFIILKV